jgi:FixJ family two-component response regulator
MSQVLEVSKAISIISIVDDDEAVRQATASLIRSLGYRALTFASADEFLNSGQVSNTSCVIGDLYMLGSSGLGLQDRLIARGHRIPIIIITGHPDDTARTRAMNAGAVAFLSKPINHDHLVGYLDKALKVT